MKFSGRDVNNGHIDDAQRLSVDSLSREKAGEKQQNQSWHV